MSEPKCASILASALWSPPNSRLMTAVRVNQNTEVLRFYVHHKTKSQSTKHYVKITIMFNSSSTIQATLSTLHILNWSDKPSRCLPCNFTELFLGNPKWQQALTQTLPNIHIRQSLVVLLVSALFCLCHAALLSLIPPLHLKAQLCISTRDP